MANALFLQELSARVEEHLHQFMDEEEEYGEPVKKKMNPVLRAGLAGGTVAGGLVAADLLDPKRRKVMKANAKDAAFTGSMRTAKAVNTVGNKVSKYGKVAKMAGERRILDKKAGGVVLKKGGDLAADAAKKLKKGSGLLRKTAMRKFFHADLAATMLRIEGKLTEFGA
jgi:hypothetical protein